MGIGIGIGLSPVFGRRGGLSQYKSLMAFWSDGVIVDGKLNNILGDQEMSPSLVESNCLQIAIDDTIAFTSLEGWSLVLNLGTAEVEISGNNILCIGAGTLYKLILNDGENDHIYPLAEGGHIIAYDVCESPQHGTIVCVDLTWTTQNEYHYNVNGNNYRDSLIQYENDAFIDSDTNGVPDGWADTYSKGGVTTADGIVRVTKNASMTSYYHMNISLPSSLTVGKKYRVAVYARASKESLLQVRYGTAATINQQAITTEWTNILFDTTVADGTALAIIGTNGFTTNDWFEFSYVLLENELSDYFYAPIKIDGSVDVLGKSLTVGNGHFIECETKLQFPDNEIYQAIDDRLEYFYNHYGEQRKLEYSRLYNNVHGLERVFNRKVDGRLTRMIIVNPTAFTRSQFISFLRSIGVSSYSYKKITKGVFLLFQLYEKAWETLGKSINDVLFQKGVTPITGLTEFPEDISTSQEQELLTFVANGGQIYTRQKPQIYYGNTSFELAESEAEEFATEISAGDLVTFVAPGGATGAHPSITWPDFTTIGTLKTTTKQTGTCKVDNTELSGYADMLWIPAGQSGVPEEFEEVPLYRFKSIGDNAEKLMYFMWPADEFFGVSFANNDEINVYSITYYEYGTLFNANGLKCTMKHHRNLYQNYNDRLKISGYLEGAAGDLMMASVGTLAFWDSGMIFGSNSGYLKPNKDIVFANQNAPRLWNGYMGHTILHSSTLETLLSTALPLIAAKNNITEDDMREWGIDTIEKFQSIIDRCDELGVLIMSPVDLIKNLQFNDYNGDDFFTD